jgi:hypothetical protein
MIKFFRRIRQSLIYQNKKGKYLKYAIGEIILVVIGILIALQINNWNDHQKEKRELYQYLAKIRNNVAQDIAILDSIKTRRVKMQVICAEATQHILNSEFEIETFIASIEAFVEYYFVPNRSGFDALKNSTYLGKINGTNLDRFIDHYYTTINQIIKEEEGFNGLIENMEYHFVSSNDLSQLMMVYFQGIESLKNNASEFKAIEKRMYELFNDNAYRAVITRTASQTAMLHMYDEVINDGHLIISEINQIIHD